MTNRQKVFIEEYVRDFNATRAAKAAGYSERSAASIGQENLIKPEIFAEIQRRIKEKTMGADEVLLRLADQARGDMGDFFDVEADGRVVFSLAKAKERNVTHLIKKLKTHTTTRVCSVPSVSMETVEGEETVETVTVDVEIELHDAQAALVHIGRHHKLFTDSTDVNLVGKVIRVTVGGEELADDE